MGKRFAWSNSSIMSVIVGVLLAFSINQGLALALATPMPVVAVESNSMVPTFQRGDILILQGVPADSLHIGDVIVFSPQGQPTPVVHRIIATNADGTLQTQGDANAGQLEFERHISPQQIEGKVIMIVPYLGWVKLVIMDIMLPNLLLVAAAMILIYAANVGLKRRGWI
jgi:signal peptidase